MEAYPITLPRLWTHDCATKKKVFLWKRVKHFDGRMYYWNTDTDETCWIPPEGIPFPKSLTEELQANLFFLNRVQKQIQETHIESIG